MRTLGHVVMKAEVAVNGVDEVPSLIVHVCADSLAADRTATAVKIHAVELPSQYTPGQARELARALEEAANQADQLAMRAGELVRRGFAEEPPQ